MTDSCNINDNQQPDSLVHNMIDDLSKFLVSYLEPLKLEFSLGEQEILLNEAFMVNGCLPLFMFDKQNILNAVVQLLNKQNPERKNSFYAKIKFINEENDNYFGILPEIEHNLISQDDEDNEAIYNPHIFYHNYYLVLNELIKSVLSDKNLSISKNGVIPLDHLYNSFRQSINRNELPIENNRA